jgi:hypothetical protein
LITLSGFQVTISALFLLTGNSLSDMVKTLNIYEMYIENNFQFGFYVRKDTWRPGRYAKVIKIEGVKEGKMIGGKPPYYMIDRHPGFGMFRRYRIVTLAAGWFENGTIEVSGLTTFDRVFPVNPLF